MRISAPLLRRTQETGVFLFTESVLDNSRILSPELAGVEEGDGIGKPAKTSAGCVSPSRLRLIPLRLPLVGRLSFEQRRGECRLWRRLVSSFHGVWAWRARRFADHCSIDGT